MGTGIGCLYTCAPFTLVAAILLFMLSVMLGSGNWTFAVLAAKHEWDAAAKARCCRNGGIIYLCISIVLWVLVAVDCLLIELEKLPSSVSKWWRQRRLPSLRELLRNRRKAADAQRGGGAATDVTVATSTAADASPADAAHRGSSSTSTAAHFLVSSDVVVSDDHHGKSAPAGTAGRSTLAGPTTRPPSTLGSAAVGSAAALGSAAPLPLVGRGYEGGALGAAPGHPALPGSMATSAATSVLEADHLLS
ncbi:hypothetical protein NESM_000342600 [Novymonas esmeraldas]|uniref:Uncharacterized protein n=1 Tax=Novymonas esmeraldas TaxID=1808958 RepID=A0AAW0EM91_9TRYP